MKYLFIGLGSIGMRHLKNLRKLTDEPICALRTNINEMLDKKYNIKSTESFQEAIDFKPDVVFITNPTKKHRSFALMFCNSHLFIEKPIFDDSCGLEELLSCMKENKKICFVGYNYRFHPQLNHIKSLLNNKAIGDILHVNIQSGQYLPDWHPNEDYRSSYAAQKNLGGGALLTMSHDIDYAYWLFGDMKVQFAELSKRSDLDIDVEDNVEIVLKTSQGAMVKIHLDYIQKIPSRKVEIIGSEGCIFWDFYRSKISLKTKNENENFVGIGFSRDKTFMYELQHFLKCIKGEEEPKIKHEDIKNVMRIIDATKEKSSFSNRHTC